MIFAILFALVLAKIKGYKLKPLLRVYALYPFAFLTAVMIYFQVCVFFHNYSWIKYAGYIKSIYLFSLVIPFLVYKLYKPGLVGALLILAGTFLNKFAIWQNGGKMPVFATLSRLTGYYSEEAIKTADNLHSIGDASTKFKILTDYIDIGYSILSIGDLLIHSFALIIMYYVIKEVNSVP
ncbi:MAG: DUF5317 domain-containing protein [Clostridiales bacterium]|nr:DUF5317 domain-containing protein [Clostridiales bacterium]